VFGAATADEGGQDLAKDKPHHDAAVLVGTAPLGCGTKMRALIGPRVGAAARAAVCRPTTKIDLVVCVFISGVLQQVAY